jgi:phosphotransacetylase
MSDRTKQVLDILIENEENVINKLQEERKRLEKKEIDPVNTNEIEHAHRIIQQRRSEKAKLERERQTAKNREEFYKSKLAQQNKGK